MSFDLRSVKFGKSDLARGILIPNAPSSELAEETGLHLGDGSMNFYKGLGLYQLRGNIISDKEHYNKVIKPLYESIYNLRINLRDMPSDSVYGFQIWSQALVSFKSSVLKLPLGFKRDFDVPKFVMGTEAYMRSFIRGVFDTDGTLYLMKRYGSLYPRIELTTISPLFAQRLYKILKLLNFRTTIGSFNGIGNRYKTYRVSCRGREMLNRWMREISPHNPKFTAKYQKFLEFS